jgi:hypothetical protein
MIMKISQATLGILKNFASINTNMLFRQGSTLATLSSGDNIFARAVVSEVFPREFAIYDLNSLLSLLTLDSDLDVEFEESALKVTTSAGVFEYFYANPQIIKAAPDKTIKIQEGYTFKLSQSDINMMLKAAAVVAAPVMSVVSKKGKVTLVLGDPKNDTANTFKRVIGEHDSDFNMMIDVERFKVIPEAYDVTINQRFFYLKSEARDLQYWLAVNPGSTY